jgi:hypothetical protein
MSVNFIIFFYDIINSNKKYKDSGFMLETKLFKKLKNWK